MPIPSEIEALIGQLNQELDRIEQEALEGMIFARSSLESFPNNAMLTQLFAYLNTSMFFVNICRRRIQTIVEKLSVAKTITNEEIQQTGEYLATELGRAIETKIRVSAIKTRLENLQ
ncbi:hypothetical protein [Aerosakkonema funiforme]|uniref:hypothetical protein n=1 Tax=Aerosakkonema funiforme TaxID=1246630 RepID=UPI0035BB79FE